ncbi:MAG: glycosyltransferase family 4 protein, partial [Anaerolineae bacterium]
MRIGFDVTAFYYSRAGVLYYRWRLLQALLWQGHAHEFALLNYLPLSQWGEPGVPLGSLDQPNAQIVTCKGIRDRKLTRWPLMTATPWQKTLAHRVDSWLEPFWERVVAWSRHRNVDRALAGVDVFHCSDVILHKPEGVPAVTTVHDLSTLLFPELHLQNTVEMHERKLRFVREQADCVIAVSEHTRQEVIEYLGVPPERVQVIYEAAAEHFHPIQDVYTIAATTHRYGLEPGSYVLTVGTLEPRKNHTRLVGAFHLLRQQRATQGLKLVLVGRKGWLCDDLFQRIQALGLTDDVIITGAIPDHDLPALMNGALVFIYPSLYEGFGLPLLEAMACGTPVIASNRSSMPEVVGDAGLLVDPEDESALAEALMAILRDKTRRQEMSCRGIEQATRFSWKKAAKQTIRVYEGCTA